MYNIGIYYLNQANDYIEINRETVNYYLFDELELSDGKQSIKVKSDYGEWKIDRDGRLINDKSQHKVVNGDWGYYPFTSDPVDLPFDYHKAYITRVFYHDKLLDVLTTNHNSDGDSGYQQADNNVITYSFSLSSKQLDNKYRTYTFTWVKNQGWTIDEEANNVNVASEANYPGYPLQLYPYNLQDGRLLYNSDQYMPEVGDWKSNATDDNSYHEKWTRQLIYPFHFNFDDTTQDVIKYDGTKSIDVIDDFTTPQDPAQRVKSENLAYLLAPAGLTGETVDDLTANLNNKYNHTFYWDPRPEYEPDKYDNHSNVVDGVIYPDNNANSFTVNLLNSPVFAPRLFGADFNQDKQLLEQHKNDVIDIEIVVNGAVVSTQTVNVVDPVLQPVNTVNLQAGNDVLTKPEITLQTNSFDYDLIMSDSENQKLGELSYGQKGWKIKYSPYQNGLSGYHPSTRSLEQTVPVVGSFVAVNGIDKNIPVLSIQSIDFITGNIILSNNSTRKLTD